MTTVNHWGKWVDSETPVTGVISANNINWEFVDDEICLVCEKIYDEIINNEICPECGGDLITKAKDYIECEECLEEWDMDDALDRVECFDHEKLIGDWILDTKTKEYSPDENGEFAAIVTDSTFNCVQVVWSKYVEKNKSLCSPCFPGQVDLDSESGEFQGYTLPPYLISKE